jgi:hypothetical protein
LVTNAEHSLSAERPITLVAHDVDLPPVQVGVGDGRLRQIQSLDDVHTALRELVGVAPQGSRTLDLIGHSTREHGFLRIGETAIDACRPAVARVFEAIRDEALLEQLGVSAVRLLGCGTATRPSGQRSLRRLARIVRLPVWGSTKDLHASHYTADGFNPTFEHILVELDAFPGSPTTR